MMRARPCASGLANSSSDPVAAADRPNPSDPDSHGSAARATASAADSTATPCDVRPSRRASIATAAMPAARTTLGSGVTNTTNPPSASMATTMRQVRPRPDAAAAAKARPTTRAQLEPDTAVRCDKEDSFIAASICSVTSRVSPTASPGTSDAPSLGNPSTAASSPRRRSLEIRRTPPAGRSSSTTVAWTCATARSPASDTWKEPRASTTAPASRAETFSMSSGATTIWMTAATACAPSPSPTALATASKARCSDPHGSILPVTVAVIDTSGPSRSARSMTCSRGPVADHTFAAATPVLSATRPISTPARRSRTARRERHVMTIAPAMTVALPAASAGATAGWTVARPATTQVSAAAGASVHALPITRRSDRACRPAASRRSPALREGRRHW